MNHVAITSDMIEDAGLGILDDKLAAEHIESCPSCKAEVAAVKADLRAIGEAFKLRDAETRRENEKS